MQSTQSSSGIGFYSLLFIVFLTLKLAEIGVVATWSWWWITSPLWIPVAIDILGSILSNLDVWHYSQMCCITA